MQNEDMKGKTMDTAIVKTLKDVSLDSIYEGSFYTIVGAGGDLKNWIDIYTEILEDKKIGQPKQ